MNYVVPITKAREDLKDMDYIVATNEAEAIGLAVGEYLATGKAATVIMGENGVLNSLDALVTLVNMYNIPIDLRVYLRNDEPQHEMVTREITKVLWLYKIKHTIIA